MAGGFNIFQSAGGSFKIVAKGCQPFAGLFYLAGGLERLATLKSAIILNARSAGIQFKQLIFLQSTDIA